MTVLLELKYTVLDAVVSLPFGITMYLWQLKFYLYFYNSGLGSPSWIILSHQTLNFSNISL